MKDERKYEKIKNEGPNGDMEYSCLGKYTSSFYICKSCNVRKECIKYKELKK